MKFFLALSLALLSLVAAEAYPNDKDGNTPGKTGDSGHPSTSSSQPISSQADSTASSSEPISSDDDRREIYLLDVGLGVNTDWDDVSETETNGFTGHLGNTEKTVLPGNTEKTVLPGNTEKSVLPGNTVKTGKNDGLSQTLGSVGELLDRLLGTGKTGGSLLGGLLGGGPSWGTGNRGGLGRPSGGYKTADNNPSSGGGNPLLRLGLGVNLR